MKTEWQINRERCVCGEGGRRVVVLYCLTKSLTQPLIMNLNVYLRPNMSLQMSCPPCLNITVLVTDNYLSPNLSFILERHFEL